MSSEIVKLFKSADITVPTDAMDKYIALYKQISGEASSVALEEVGSNWRPAQLKLVQPVTTDQFMPAAARTGDLYWTGNLVKRPMSFLVAYIFPTRARFVKGVDKSPSCRSENVDLKNRGKFDKSKSVYGDECAKCPTNDQPFTGGVQTNCTDSLNVVMVPEDLSTILIMAFKSSSAQVGRRLVDMVRSSPTPWSRYYNIDSEQRKRETGGIYAVPTITPVADKPVPAHLAKFAADVVCPQMSASRQEAKLLVLKRQDDVNNVLKVVNDENGAVRDSM
jgi:hypothetical protein